MIEVPAYKIKPRTNLGYTLGVNRDKDIIRDPRQRNVADGSKKKGGQQHHQT